MLRDEIVGAVEARFWRNRREPCHGIEDCGKGIGIDVDQPCRVFGKGAKERVVPLGRCAKDALEEWLAPGGRDELAPERWARRGDAEAVLLGETDAAAMSEIALSTKPGPWGEKTRHYGAFYGVRRDGRLVLIALQRGARAEIDFNAVMRNRLVITGSTMRPRTTPEKTQIRDALLREHPSVTVEGLAKAKEFNAQRYYYQGIGRFDPDAAMARGLADLAAPARQMSAARIVLPPLHRRNAGRHWQVR